MTLSEDEKAALKLELSSLEKRAKTIWKRLEKVYKLKIMLEAEHEKIRKKYEAADRKIAMEERLTVLPLGGKRKEKRLTREQLLAIVKELEEESVN